MNLIYCIFHWSVVFYAICSRDSAFESMVSHGIKGRNYVSRIIKDCLKNQVMIEYCGHDVSGKTGVHKVLLVKYEHAWQTIFSPSRAKVLESWFTCFVFITRRNHGIIAGSIDNHDIFACACFSLLKFYAIEYSSGLWCMTSSSYCKFCEVVAIPSCMPISGHTSNTKRTR